MMLLNACPRCGGTLCKEQDEFGQFWHCLACGNHLYSLQVRSEQLPLSWRYGFHRQPETLKKLA